MRRWAFWLFAVAVLCIGVYSARSESMSLLEDTDTTAILAGIRHERDPLVWFKGDWPLKNHFYRPVSTLTFALDDALYAGDAIGYGRTNAVLGIISILLLFWLVREVTDKPLMAGLSSALFAVWHFGLGAVAATKPVLFWLGIGCLFGALRGGRQGLVNAFLGFFACAFCATQILPVVDFSSDVMQWLPGRTASVMTVFALVSLSAYARHLRTTSIVWPTEPSSEDVPATKSSFRSPKARNPWILLVASNVALMLALGSYEQAVMLPALLFGLWLLFRLRGFQASWWPHAAFWLVLVGYLVVRSTLVPSGASGYQEQQFRSGPGVWIVLGDYALPNFYAAYLSFWSLSSGVSLLLLGGFWAPVFAWIGTMATSVQVIVSRKSEWILAGFFVMSAVAFLPMAWLHEFGHYHYLPSALRSAYAVALGCVVLKLVASAVSPPATRAPLRQDPAPGSLLHQ